MTLEGTPDIVSAEGVKGLKFDDEVETINKYAKELQKQGVKSIVALIHEGGAPASTAYNYDCDSPGAGDGISGPIVDIAKNVTPKVDALVTGHTHQAYACTIPDPAGKPRMVTSAASFGRLYTDTTLTYDRRTDDIARTAVKSGRTTSSPGTVRQGRRHDGPDHQVEHARRPDRQPPASATSPATSPARGPGTESPLGDLIADAQLGTARPGRQGRRDARADEPGRHPRRPRLHGDAAARATGW